MEEMKGITCCGDCIHYNWKKHKCNLGCKDEGLATDHFYKDCPLPKVQPVNQWIPCSERLPESYKVVVASIRAETGYIKKPYVWDVCKAYICGDGSWETSLTGTRNLVVEAWLPLPEPYKESD